MRSIPPKTSTGSLPRQGFSSIDPVRFRTRGFNIQTNSSTNKFSSQENSESYSIKRWIIPKTINQSLGLQKLLAESERRLKKTIEKLQSTYDDNLIDKYSELDNVIRQLRWQIAIRKGR